MAFMQPTYSSLQKMKDTSLHARSASGPSARVLSHRPAVECLRGLANANGKRIVLADLSAKSQVSFRQPEVEFLVDLEDIPLTASKARAESETSPNVQTASASLAKPIQALHDSHFHHPDLQAWPATDTKSNTSIQQREPAASSSQSPGVRTDASLMHNPPHQPANKPRYYSPTTPDADTHGLPSIHKDYKPHKSSPLGLLHDEPHKQPVPRRPVPSVEQTKALSGLEHEQRRRHRHHTFTTATSKNGCTASSPLRTISPLANPDAHSTNTNTPPIHRRQPQPHHHHHHANRSLLNLGIPNPHLPTPLTPIPTPTSFQPNPTTTFDAFLAPHKSGKGETYVHSPNAKPSPRTVGLSTARDASPLVVSRRVRLAGMLFGSSRKDGGGTRGGRDVDGEAGEAEAEGQGQVRGGVLRRFLWE